MCQDSNSEKQASSWKVSDVAKLVGTEEGVYLEFKKPSEFIKNGNFSRDLAAKEITETVSAFLNSDGGIILVGVQTNKYKRDKKTESLKSFDSWATDQTFEHLGISLTRSQIRDLIYGNIVPRPVGVEVKDLDISIGEAKTTVFVVTVSASPLGAHQSAKTWRYYRRTADGDEPMLDFEIRDVNNRRAGPLLHLVCKVTDSAGTSLEGEWKKSRADMKRGGSEEESFYRVNLVVATSNLGRGTADIARFDIGIPNPWWVRAFNPDGINTGAHWVPKSELRYSIDSLVTVFWTPSECSEIPHPYRDRKLSEQQVTWQQVIYSGNETPGYPIWPTSDFRIIGVIELQRRINRNATPIPFLWLPWRALSSEIMETRGATLLREYANEIFVNNYEMDEVCWCHHAEDITKFEELKQRFKVR